MSQPFRLAKGGCIDRSTSLQFSFNGQSYEGHPGDTLAAALLANGVRIVGRSFKFHRPRGVLSAGAEEPNALLTVDDGTGPVPIERATTVPLVDGLQAETQAGFPSVNFDVGRILDFTHALWPAGFYNKTFKWPGWRTWEGAVRRLAGLGRLPGDAPRRRFRHANDHCDVLVVGAGPAGLAAALAAARDGEDVILVEQDFEAGGSLLYDRGEIDGEGPRDRTGAVLAELESSADVRLLLRASAVAFFDHNVVAIHDRSQSSNTPAPVEVFRKVRAGRVVLATGAIEQPLLFGCNDLPGIMLARAMEAYAVRFGVRCGRNVVGIVNNDLAWRSAFALHDAGIRVKTVIDLRDAISEALRSSARDRGIATEIGATPLRARGRKCVTGIEFQSADGDKRSVACDAIAMSGGLSPTLHLYSQAGGKLRYDDALACFLPDRCAQSVEVVGAAAGDFGSDVSYDVAPRRAAAVGSSRQWVDFLHDVTVSDIELAVRENFTAVEHLKRYTTTGMAADQGKTSSLNALTLLGNLTDRQPGDVGTTTFRPMYRPVTLGAIAGNRRGDFYAPARQLPAHDWHVARDAVFDDYGGWQRPAWYGSDRDAAIADEVLTVRNKAGLFDGSPLGKIEVRGPDAAEFLNRIYVNTVTTLDPGRIRYGLMLNENGIVIDDGVFVRLADDHFLVNTTSGNAERICAWLDEWHQCEWPKLELVICPATTQWAVATIAGPKSRAVLGALPGMTDLSGDRLPHMGFTNAQFDDGTPYRLQRVSYSGELGYELSVPANRASEWFERIGTAGEPFGLGLFGIEALQVLRTEKGFLHVGADTDGTTNAFDVGFRRIVDNKQGDFVGARSLQRPEDQRTDRRQFVGIEPDNPEERLLAGAHFVTTSRGGMRSEGFVTSACRSPTLGKFIGLGLLERGFERIGETVQLFDEGRMTTARVVETCFFDPYGERMHG